MVSGKGYLKILGIFATGDHEFKQNMLPFLLLKQLSVIRVIYHEVKVPQTKSHPKGKDKTSG